MCSACCSSDTNNRIKASRICTLKLSFGLKKFIEKINSPVPVRDDGSVKVQNDSDKINDVPEEKVIKKCLVKLVSCSLGTNFRGHKTSLY